jgi:hypothetical protein
MPTMMRAEQVYLTQKKIDMTLMPHCQIFNLAWVSFIFIRMGVIYSHFINKISITSVSEFKTTYNSCRIIEDSRQASKGPDSYME